MLVPARLRDGALAGTKRHAPQAQGMGDTQYGLGFKLDAHMIDGKPVAGHYGASTDSPPISRATPPAAWRTPACAMPTPIPNSLCVTCEGTFWVTCWPSKSRPLPRDASPWPLLG